MFLSAFLFLFAYLHFCAFAWLRFCAFCAFVLLDAFWCVQNLFVKKKKFKTALITSFILLLVSSCLRGYFVGPNIFSCRYFVGPIFFLLAYFMIQRLSIFGSMRKSDRKQRYINSSQTTYSIPNRFQQLPVRSGYILKRYLIY